MAQKPTGRAQRPFGALAGKRPALLPRLLPKLRVDPETGCWIWTGARHKQGYGVIGVRGKVRRVHVVLWELWYSRRVPPGKGLDHFKCDTPACARPQHVRPVTSRENTLRGNSVAAANLAKSHCPHGHPYDGSNLYVAPDGGRECRACGRRRDRERRGAWK